MPRSRSTVRIASTSRPENCAGWRDGVARREVAPERLAAELAPEHRAARGSGSTPALVDRVLDGARRRAGMIGCGAASITSRATAPFWRASTKRPATSIVRSTFGAAETSISVTIVTLATGAIVGATGPADRPAVRRPPLAAIASTRSPRSSSRWPKPSSASVPVTPPPGVDHAQRAVGDGEDPPAVGLDDVRLVDVGLLRVGAGEVRDRRRRPRVPPRTARRGSRRSPRRSPSVRCGISGGVVIVVAGGGDRAAGHADAALRAQRAVARVADEVLAGGEGLQARPRRRRPRRRPPTRASDECDRRGDSHLPNVLSMCRVATSCDR